MLRQVLGASTSRPRAGRAGPAHGWAVPGHGGLWSAGAKSPWR